MSNSYKAQMHVYLLRTSTEMHMKSDIFDLFNTKCLCRNAVLHQGDDVADLPPNNLMIC
jgi:hypothetical protein